MASRLPRSAPHPYNQPVSPSVSPKSYTSIRPLSPDAYELKKENEGLKKENEGLKKFLYQLNMQLSEEQNKSRRLEYRELLRKALQNEVLAAKGPGAAELRRKIIEDVNNDEKKDNNEAIFGPITAEAYIGEVDENKRGGGGKSRRNKRGGGNSRRNKRGGGNSRRKTNRTRKKR